MLIRLTVCIPEPDRLDDWDIGDIVKEELCQIYEHDGKAVHPVIEETDIGGCDYYIVDCPFNYAVSAIKELIDVSANASFTIEKLSKIGG